MMQWTVFATETCKVTQENQAVQLRSRLHGMQMQDHLYKGASWAGQHCVCTVRHDSVTRFVLSLAHNTIQLPLVKANPLRGALHLSDCILGRVLCHRLLYCQSGHSNFTPCEAVTHRYTGHLPQAPEMLTHAGICAGTQRVFQLLLIACLHIQLQNLFHPAPVINRMQTMTIVKESVRRWGWMFWCGQIRSRASPVCVY